MSRKLVGWAMVIGFGVLNGYITFKPAFEELELEKIRQERELAPPDLGPEMIEITAQNPQHPIVSESAKRSAVGSGSGRLNARANG